MRTYPENKKSDRKIFQEIEKRDSNGRVMAWIEPIIHIKYNSTSVCLISTFDF